MPDLKPAMHGRDHCPGGADPIPCLDTSSVRSIVFDGYNYANTGDDEIPDDDWTDVAINGQRWWLQGSHSHPDDNPGWFWDLDTGIIGRNEFAHYLLVGVISFPDITSGHEIGAGIVLGNSNNFMFANAYTFPTAGGVPHQKITVTVPWWGGLDFGGQGARLLAYQKSGGPLTLGRVHFHVHRFALEPADDAGFFEHE
jgi:hypothetical protein